VKGKGEIQALTGLRAVAALWVLALHVSHLLRATGGDVYGLASLAGAGGFLGVDIFFVLSGFILAYNYADAGPGSPRSYGHFLWKRLARIYPVHIAALVLFCVYLLATVAFDLPYGAYYRLTWNSLLQHLTLTHAWALPVPKSWNVVSWSISAEWAAYLCFPLMVVLAGRVRSIAVAAGMIALLFGVLSVCVSRAAYGGTMAYGLARIAVEFPAGVLLFRIWSLTACRRSPQGDLLAALAGLALFLGGNALAIASGGRATLAIVPLLAGLLVYGIAAASGPVARILASPLMAHLGRVSYAFYMVHLTMLGAAAAYAREHNLQHREGIMIALVLAAILAAYAMASWIYVSIEKPARSYLVRLLPAASDRQVRVAAKRTAAVKSSA
jgi:peptidoglycan/LPS O-acetylase OafA/YrhL